MAKTVLVINSGSSSIKYQLVDLETGEGIASGLVEKIGEPVDGHYKHEYNGEKHELEEPIHDHEQGLKRVLGFFDEFGPKLADAGIVAVGHRVVQGGSIFPKPALVNDKTIGQVKDLAVLAPLHNGPEAKGAEVMRSLLPDVPQIFVFDSSFFFQLPKASSTYALNKEVAQQYHIRRYGAHGTSHEFISSVVPSVIGKPAEGLKQIDDEPCAVMLSATGLIARTSEDAVERWENRSASDGRAKDDQIVSMFRTSTRSSYGLVTSAGRLVLAHVVELPKVSADGPPRSCRMCRPCRSNGQLVPLALGTRNGVVKRWNRESPTTMDSWSVIDLKDDDEVLAAAEARDEDRLVFVSTDSSLLTFEAKNVRPQGRTAGGMAGIRLAEGCSVAAFAVVPDGKVTWNYEEGENGLFSASGAVVLTVAGDSEALPGTENGAAKVTPLEMYPTKGRGTGGVRSQRFLKGQDTLILAFVGAYPLHASTQSGAPVELPKPDMRRDGSGTDLSAPIAVVG